MTLTATASNYTLSVFTINNNYPPSNSYTNTTSTTYSNYLANKGQTGTLYLRGYDFSQIPSNAIINSVTIKVKCMVSSTANISSATVQACKNTTTIGSSQNFRSTTASVYTLNLGNTTWNRQDLDNIQLKFIGTSAKNNAYIRVYGSEILINYTLAENKFYVKDEGSWKSINKIFKKSSGVWLDQTNNIFNQDTKYQIAHVV